MVIFIVGSALSGLTVTATAPIGRRPGVWPRPRGLASAWLPRAVWVGCKNRGLRRITAVPRCSGLLCPGRNSGTPRTVAVPHEEDINAVQIWSPITQERARPAVQKLSGQHGPQLSGGGGLSRQAERLAAARQRRRR